LHKEITTDVVIAGGGIIGVSTAYNLALKGKNVVVVERNRVASQGSGRNAGGVRAQGRLPAELPIVLEAIEIWKRLDAELGIETEYRQTGSFFMATDDKEIELHKKMTSRLNRDGLQEARVLDEPDVLKLIPALKPGMCRGGSYCSIDGMANPINATLGFARAAERKGVRIIENEKVERVDVQNGSVVGVTTCNFKIRSEQVLLATASWTQNLVGPLGLDVPISPCRNQIFVTEVLPPLIKPFFLTPTVYCNQTYNGNMLVGNVDPDDFCLGNCANPNETKKIARKIIQYIPALASVNIIRTWGGPLDLTPDDKPILGRVTRIGGLLLACGFSGHGFASAPYLGLALSELISSGKQPFDLHPFRYERFEEGETSEADEAVYAYGQAVGKNRGE